MSNSLLLLCQSCMTFVPISISQTEFSLSFGANYTNSIRKCLDNTAPMFNTLNMVLLPRAGETAALSKFLPDSHLLTFSVCFVCLFTGKNNLTTTKSKQTIS